VDDGGAQAAGTGAGTGGRASAPGPVRWPAEWEPHAATWLCWPKNPDTWPGLLDRAEAAFARIIEALVPGERVRLLVDDAPAEERVRDRLRREGVDPDRGIDYLAIPTDDAWIRDHGPVHVFERAGGARWLIDFGFDAWGGKYPPWERDARVGEEVALRTGFRRRAVASVLEAGSIDGDGQGSVLTTEQCLLHPNRTPGGTARTRAEAEALLADTLGIERVIWLGDGIVGDDTDGHVDDVTRFVALDTVVTAVEPDPADPNHAPLAANLERLRAARTASGRPYEVVELPMPAPVVHAGTRLPASYANFYIANRAVLVPAFGQAADARAAAILGSCLPGREIVAIPSSALVAGLGAVHCLTHQEPAAPGASPADGAGGTGGTHDGPSGDSRG